MSTENTTDLLRAFQKLGSEDAFQEIVTRYVDLVYSVALRRVNGDTHFAEDVVQMVFADLARKAASLPGNLMLGGWLHHHTCFVAGNLLRAEKRRTAREQEAVMNLSLESSESEWHNVAPFLDEAIEKLEDPDRTAIVLRYLERRDLRSVGLSLGVSEDTAQKRVSRAVDKLRALLSEQGVALTIAALTTVLATRAVIAAPGDLAPKACKSAMAGQAAGAGFVALLAQLFSFTITKIAATVVVIATIALAATHDWAPSKPAEGGTIKRAAAGTNSPGNTTGSAVFRATAAAIPAPGSVPADTNVLHLLFLSADKGLPLRTVRVEMRAVKGGKFSHQTLHGNRNGICDVSVARNQIESLELTTQLEGYADTKLQWRPDRGETIPSNYTLRIIRAQPISGTVVDADGRPVAGAKIGFNHDEDVSTKTLTENHDFSFINVETDTVGKWQINRIAPEMIRRIRGGATHPEYIDSEYLFAGHDSDAEKAMRDGTHVFRLGRPIEVRGLVVDSEGKPIAGAQVLVGGKIMSDQRKSKTEADGTFTVRGCKPGKNLLSADVEGFATTTTEIDAAADSSPFRLVMKKGSILRIRVVDTSGTPIAKAYVGLNTNPNRPYNPMKPAPPPPPSQASFSAKSDKEGRVVWNEAPDMELLFNLTASNHMVMRDVMVRPDGEEHIITMPPALVVFGTVKDAVSGELIPRFRVITGWPSVRYLPLENPTDPARPMLMITNAQWSTLERFWMSFANGQYRHSFEEPVVGGMENRGYLLKFEADGYAPTVSRLIKADEGQAQIEVSLQPAHDLEVAVLQPDGSTAAAADIGLIAPGVNLYLVPGGLSHLNPQSAGSLLYADSTGKFKLPPDSSIARVIITHHSGFADVTPAQLATTPSVRLQPWGNIEGTYLAGGRPAAGRNIRFEYGKTERGTIASDHSAFAAETDTEGRFSFHNVPPGKHKLIRMVPAKSPLFPGLPPGGKSWQEETLAEVEVRSGDTTNVTLGATNYAVSFRIGWPGEMQKPQNSRIDVFLGADLPPAIREHKSDRVVMAEWRKTPEYQAWQSTRNRYHFAEHDDGTFEAEGIPPGNYSVGVSVMVREPSVSRQVAVGEMPFSIPAEAPVGTLDLGELPLRKVEPR